VRRAGAEDAGLLSRLKVTIFRLSYRGILPSDLLDGLGDNPHVGVSWWRRFLLDPACEAWVIETGEPAGFLCLMPPPPFVPNAKRCLDQLYLLPTWQSGGLGSAVWRHAVNHMRAVDVLPFALTVFEGNDRARRFYNRRGGRIVDRRPAFDWKGRPFYEVVYLFDET